MARGNLRRVRERNGSHIITIPSTFVAQMRLEDETMMEISIAISLAGKYRLVMEVVEAEGDG